MRHSCSGSCGNADHGHDHDLDGANDSAWGLFSQIDNDRISTLNVIRGTELAAFKPRHLRMDRQTWLQSDVDCQILLTIPFLSAVTLTSLCVIGGSRDGGIGAGPSKMLAWANRDNLDFDSVGSVPPTQQWDLSERNERGLVELPTRGTPGMGIDS